MEKVNLIKKEWLAKKTGRRGAVPQKNLLNQKFNYLLVIGGIGRGATNQYHWLCKCDCGRLKIYRQDQILLETVKSCGCKRGELISKLKTIHGGRKKPEYYVWVDMKQRCLNPNVPEYKNWGGRGIKICNEWLNSFPKFYTDMGPRPTPKHSLDRINVNGNYELSNCRWATWKQQANNRRNSKK